MDSKNPQLKYLNDIRDRLDHVDYNQIYKCIADLKDKFIPTALLHKGHYIDRVRINKNGEVFKNEHQVSYVHDQEVLEKCVNYGRSNLPKQAVFYGAIESPKIDQPRVVAWLETTRLFDPDNPIPDNVVEIFTMSRWRILDEIQIIEMIFSDEALKSDYNKMSLENQLKNIYNLPLKDHYIEQGRFFSNEFSRLDIRSKQEYKYKISSAYANYIWEGTKLKGITYPSVKTWEFEGQNVALLPEVVDQFLQLESVAMFKFERKNKKNLPVYCFKVATDLGENNMNFKWEDYNE